jgi:hypothetical protein
VSSKLNSGLMLVAILACAVVTPAKAMTYDLAFSGGQSGSLVLDNLSGTPTGTYTGAALKTFLSSSFVSLDAGKFKNQQFDIGSSQSADITKLVFSSTGALIDINASIKISSPADTLIYSGLTYYFENPDGHSLGSGTFSASTSVSATPLPDGLPLFATGLAMLGLLGWRMRRRNTSNGPALTAI